jgi:hypothetical protein
VQAEAALREVDARRGAASRPSLRPLGRFLCPQCHATHLISRLGVSVLPLSRGLGLEGKEDEVKEEEEGLDKELATVLQRTLAEVGARLRGVELDIGRVRAARRLGGEGAAALSLQLDAFYLGQAQLVEEHAVRLGQRAERHAGEAGALLLREEVQLEQARGDLRQLREQLRAVLRAGAGPAARLVGPLAGRLDRIGRELRAAGRTAIHLLQFVPGSLPGAGVPGYLSTFTVCPAASHAVIDRPVYEKVLSCSLSSSMRPLGSVQYQASHG